MASQLGVDTKEEQSYAPTTGAQVEQTNGEDIPTRC